MPRDETVKIGNAACLVRFAVRARDRLDANQDGISHEARGEARNQNNRKCPCRVRALLGMFHDDAANSMNMTSSAGLATRARYHLAPNKGNHAAWGPVTGRAGSTRANAHAGSRARVTSVGGLYDAATLHALLELFRSQTIGVKSVTCFVGFVVRARGRLDANKVGISHGDRDEARNQ